MSQMVTWPALGPLSTSSGLKSGPERNKFSGLSVARDLTSDVIDRQAHSNATDPGLPPSVLAITSEPPWPLNTGGHLRTHYILRALAGRFRLRLITGSAVPVDLAELSARGVESTVVDLPSRSARTEAGRVARAAFSQQPYVMYRRHDWKAVREAVRSAIAVERPDVLYLDHLDSFLYAQLAPPGTRLAIDLHNIYSLIAERTAQETSGIRRLYLNREASLLRRVEKECARRCDVITAVSADEARWFQDLGHDNVHTVPNGVDCQRYHGLPEGRKDGEPTILYLGAMSWRPNATAAQFLASEVLPIVRNEVPGAALRIVGRDPLPEVSALGKLPGVTVTGAVESVMPHLAEAHVLAVPLESGGGTRLNILVAVAAGVPGVSATVGAEGIDAIPGVHFLQAERPQFARALVTALQDQTTCRQLPIAARRLVLEKYDWRAVGARAIDAILDGLARHPRSLDGR